MAPNATLQVTGAVGWRREGLVYKKNEVITYLSSLLVRIEIFPIEKLKKASLRTHGYYIVCLCPCLLNSGFLGHCRECKPSHVL